MNVPLITESPSNARAKLKSYRTALHRKVDSEYQQVEQAYQELARGHSLVALSEAIAAAPVDAQGRPRLAIARADRQEVRFTWDPWQHRAAFDTEWNRRRGRAPHHTRIVVSLSGNGTRSTGFALVPLVPPEVKRHHALERCHVLWEVEQWAGQSVFARSDRDPYLLRFVGGDLWAVLGEWSLTEVERGIMVGRRA